MRGPSRRELIETISAAVAVSLTQTVSRASPPKHTKDMVLIPAGKFLMGTTRKQALALATQHGFHATWLEGEVPQAQVDLPAFFIDVHPVTVAEYALFCLSTGHPMPDYWPPGTVPKPYLYHPVRMVSWFSARQYAQWVGKRLPTEAQWEKAARGTDGRTFPWGNTFDPDACQWNRYGTSSGPDTARVMTHPGGDSPYGVTDMVGNVAEWCLNGPNGNVAYVKGGGWYTEEILNLRPAGKYLSAFRNVPGTQFGFRCSMDVI